MRDTVVRDALATALRGEPVDWAAIPGTPADWAWVSTVQGVAPLLADALSDAQAASRADGLTGALVDGLTETTRTMAAVNLARRVELAALADALARAQISALLIKGAALAHTVYDEPYHRMGIDTDLLIPIDAVQPTLKVLQRLGYEVSGSRYKSHQYTAHKPGPGGVQHQLDVHWRVNNAPRFARVLSFETLADEAVTLTGLEPWQGPSLVHALLIACIHRAGNPRHDPDRLVWLVDVLRLLSAATSAERHRFWTQAEALGVTDVCRDAVQAARIVGLPKALLEEMPSEIQSGEPSTRSRFGDSQLALVLSDLRELPGSGDRLRLLRELFLPRPAELQMRFDERRKSRLPWLYLRYLGAGLSRHLSLR